jgi:hypothetical protein
VAALRNAAGRRPKDLRVAAAAVRSHYWITESRFQNRANESLLAALADRPVQPLTHEQVVWSRRIERLNKGDREAAFRRLVPMQPALADLERTVREAVARAETTPVGSGRIQTMISQRLRPLVGPDADIDDPLLLSHSAYLNAEQYLWNLAFEVTKGG